MSKPIDQERADFEAWFAREIEPSVSYGNPDILRRSYWTAWQARAAVQPAGVVVAALNKTRDQWQKVDARFCADNNSPAANMHLIKDAQRDIELLHRALAAAPHPVSGEQTVDQHNAAYWQEQYELLRKDYQRSLDERAQDVAGLVEALEQIEDIELVSAGSVSEWHDSRVRIREVIGRALAAHRAQQGEQQS